MANIHIDFFSKVLGKLTNMNVILPDSTDVPENGWKTVVLLHGWSGDYTDWVRQTSIERYATARNIAVVMPDGGFSFYNNMVHGLDYMDFLTKELPEVCSAYFRCSTRREDNFIGGLSMGGCGAVSVGLTHPELYAGIICLSASNFPVEAFPGQYEKSPWPTWLKSMIAIYGDTVPNWKGTDYDHYTLAEKIVKAGGPFPRIFHTTGMDEGPGYEFSLKMEKFFLGIEGNPFEYTFKGYPGLHNWEYWDAHICEALDYMGLTPVKA